MLGADEENVVVLAIPDGAQQAGDELYQASGLFELLVFLKQRDDVFEPRADSKC